MKREVDSEWVRFTLPDGRVVAALVDVVPEDAPYRVREGIARRRVTTMTGQCPCGATLDLNHQPLDDGACHPIEHHGRCPAGHRLEKEVRRWLR